MNTLPHEFGELLDLHLDGQLSEAQRATFDHMLEQDPALREEFVRAESQNARIEASLRRVFDPEHAQPSPFDHAKPEVSTHPRGLARWRYWLAAAAAIVLLVGGGTLLWPRPTPLREAYNRQLAVGFVPQERCTSIPQFGEWLEQNYGAWVAPDRERENIEYVGWSYSRTISSYTGLLLARVEGHEVVVVLDTAVQDGYVKPVPSAGKGLNVFRRELCGLVFYEVSPLDHAGVVDHLVCATDPQADGSREAK